MLDLSEDFQDSIEYDHLMSSNVSWKTVFESIETFPDPRFRYVMRKLGQDFIQDKVEQQLAQLHLNMTSNVESLIEAYYYFGLLSDPLLDYESYRNEINGLISAFNEKMIEKGIDIDKLRNSLEKPKLPGFGQKFYRDTAESVIENLNELLFSDLQLRPENSTFFRIESHCVHELTKKGAKGIPIALSALYIIIAQSHGLPIFGVNMPRHFLVKWQYQGSEYFVDPYNRGEVIHKESIYQLLSQQKYQVTPQLLEPTTYRIMIKRALTNLLPLYKRDKNENKKVYIERLISLLHPPTLNS